MTASIRHFVSTVPLASVATAISRASSKSKRQPPAPPTARGPPTNNGRQPCNRTRQELDELLQKNNGTPNYSLYFFNVASKKGDWKRWESQYNDDLERCKDCGLKISEHRAAASSSTPKTVDEILEASAKVEFKVPPRAVGRRIGRGGFDTEVHDVIRECAPITNQDSKALVLMSASGVGKTFATMTFRACSQRMSPRPPYECLTIYLGLNQGWCLTSQERAYLEAVEKGKGFLEVERVLLQRLLIALDFTLTKCQGDLNRLNEVRHDGQKIPLPKRGIIPFSSEIDMESVKEAIYERVSSLLELCPKRESGYRLVVLVALDEAQLLDELISPSEKRYKKSGGARYGLRVLRQLQVLAYEETEQQCLLLPIATGIRPTVSLSSRTEGENICVGTKEDDAAHVSFDHFRTIVYEHIKKLLRGSKFPKFNVGKAVTLLTAAFYPCVRDMQEWKVGDDVKPIDATLNIPADVAVKILMADFARTSGLDNVKLATVKLDLIPLEIPVARIERGVAQPLVHFSVFGPLCDCIVNERRIKRRRALPRLPLGTVDIKDNCTNFEVRMFQIFGLFMSLFCDPRAPDAKKFRTILHRVINEWLPKRAYKLGDECYGPESFDESKFHYLPFEKLTNHEDACKGPIFEGVLSPVMELHQDCAAWMRFGGEAPVDYMLFVRREGNRMEVRYGDAKHHKDGVPSQQRDVVAKARMVHAGLKRELRKHGLSLEKFDKSHVLLFTNVPTEEAVSPKTFCWSPWTPFVFQSFFAKKRTGSS